MTQTNILNLTHDQILTYVEQQVALDRDRVSAIREIAALRNDVTLLSVREDEFIFEQKVKATLNTSRS
ncbi:MAG: hypothetical protein JO235_15990 [Chroococcidiopsidaceae cyanobacterium CP_BM_RX_35]|nr:hypothetical protein [Chroococcidiopsidaceae cyanobacterium CP_BM_RX_35]